MTAGGPGSTSWVGPGPQTDGVDAIRVATPEDAAAAGRILAAGFEDDPVLSWVMSEPGRGQKLQALFTTIMAGTFGPAGASLITDEAVAAWLPPPGRAPENPEQGATMLDVLLAAGCTGDDLGRLGVLGEATGEVHPTEPHWYLGMLATLPELRGRGLGGALLTASLERVDADGSPAYLESSNPRNIGLYERHGFEVTGRIDLGDGPPMFPMWRPAR